MHALKLLAIDTSTELLSIAVQDAQGQTWVHEAEGGAKASAALLPAIHALMAQAKLRLAALDAVVYGCGPGSFTGLRTTCAVAQGLVAATQWGADPKNLPAIAVNALMATAEDARLSAGVEQVVVALDARMGEVYTCQYAWRAGVWQAESTMQACRPEAVTLPEGYVLVGNAHSAYALELDQIGHNAISAGPRALAMMGLAPHMLADGQGRAAQEIMPLYIRNKVAMTTEERLALKAGQSGR